VSFFKRVSLNCGFRLYARRICGEPRVRRCSSLHYYADSLSRQQSTVSPGFVRSNLVPTHVRMYVHTCTSSALHTHAHMCMRNCSDDSRFDKCAQRRATRDVQNHAPTRKRNKLTAIYTYIRIWFPIGANSEILQKHGYFDNPR